MLEHADTLHEPALPRKKTKTKKSTNQKPTTNKTKKNPAEYS